MPGFCINRTKTGIYKLQFLIANDSVENVSFRIDAIQANTIIARDIIIKKYLLFATSTMRWVIFIAVFGMLVYLMFFVIAYICVQLAKIFMAECIIFKFN